jgi:hypothetical protein
VATYTFNNTFTPLESGAPSLTATDPLATSGFQVMTVFGQSRTVYHFDGLNSPATSQGGLTLGTTGLIPANNYSVEMVFEFAQRDGNWRRILDVQNRSSDNGFYVNTGNALEVFGAAGTGGVFTTGSFFDVFLTVDAANQVNAYFGGVLQLTTTTTVMDINNPGNLLNLFLDNTVGGGQGEWSNGDISLFKVYDHALTAGEVRLETADPFATVVPEPATSALWISGGALLLLGRLRRRR